MKIDQIQDGKEFLDVRLVDFENFFDVYVDKNNRDMYYFNLNSTMYIDGDSLPTYELSHNLFWTQISYNIYKTTRLWWILMKVNNIQIDNAFDIIEAGSSIKYIPIEQIQQITEMME